MSIIGAILSLAAGFFYSLRFSFTKDLGKYAVNRESVNFFYRLVSLPFIAGVLLISRESLLNLKSGFQVWFLLAITVHVAFGLYQVYLYQKHKFSSIETLSFLEILFTTIAGFLVFGEVLSTQQIIGVGAIALAFVVFTVFGSKKGLQWSFAEIIGYYAFTPALNIVNKKAILNSSPLLYVFYLTFGLVIVNYLLTLRKTKSLYRWNDKKANKLLILVGILASASFIGGCYGYIFLPVGIVSALISLKVFISLWISHKKYGEKNLLPKVVSSVIAVIGTVILFL